MFSPHMNLTFAVVSLQLWSGSDTVLQLSAAHSYAPNTNVTHGQKQIEKILCFKSLTIAFLLPGGTVGLTSNIE